MKSLEQFLEDAPVRTYNDPSVIASPEARRRAGRREIEKDYVDTQDIQATAAALRKPSVETEKEKKFGLGSGQTMSSGFDKSGVAGTKENDRKPLELRYKSSNPAIDKLKEKFKKNREEKEGILPGDIKQVVDNFTTWNKDSDTGEDMSPDMQLWKWKLMNTMVEESSGKYPLMDLMSAGSNWQSSFGDTQQFGFQKRLQTLKELIDNDDLGELDDDKISPILKMRSELKDKAYEFTEKMDDQGYDPFELLDNIEDSEEMISDVNVEDNDIGNSGDFVPHNWRRLGKVLQGLPNTKVREFLGIVDDAQARYKKGDLNFMDLGKEFLVDDEPDVYDEMEYEGVNSSWSLTEESMENNDITPMNDEVGIDSDIMREVAWGTIIDPQKIEASQGGTPEQILKGILTVGKQSDQQRIMAMLNDYLDKSGSSIEDALSEDGLKSFADFARRLTTLDALKTWRNQIMPDLEDGQILRNSPAYGGRDGNARERIYKKAGFGEILSDDYQYGQKKEGESRLRPLSSIDLNVFDEEESMNQVYDEFSSYLPDDDDLPFERWEFDDVVVDYFHDRDDYQRFRDNPSEVFQEIYDKVFETALDSFDFDMDEYLSDEQRDTIGDEDDLEEFIDWAQGAFINDLGTENQSKVMAFVRNDNSAMSQVMDAFITKFKEQQK